MITGRVSIITTCYNYAHFLPIALESALQQTYTNIEMVVVNDGSPDNTDEVMQPYLADPRVVYVNQANAGQAIATNNGIKAASGEFIAFLDADDIWAAHKLKRQIPLFDDPEVGVVYCLMDLMNEDGDSITRGQASEFLQPRSGWILKHIFFDNFVPFSGAVVRRKCFDKAGMLDPGLKMSTDWDLWLRVATHYKFDFVNEPLLRYRLGHAGQMTKNYDAHEKDQTFVMNRFVQNYGDLLPGKLIDQAYALTYCNRAYRQRALNGRQSLDLYLKAIRAYWTYAPAYMGIAKLFVYKTLRFLGINL